MPCESSASELVAQPRVASTGQDALPIALKRVCSPAPKSQTARVDHLRPDASSQLLVEVPAREERSWAVLVG